MDIEEPAMSWSQKPILMNSRNLSKYFVRHLIAWDAEYAKQIAEMVAFHLKVAYRLLTACIVDSAMIFQMGVSYFIQSEQQVEMEL